MKCSKYFGTKWRGFIKSESILVPKGASRFKTQNIRYDNITHRFLFQGEDVMVEELVQLLVRVVDAKLEKHLKTFCLT